MGRAKLYPEDSQVQPSSPKVRAIGRDLDAVVSPPTLPAGGVPMEDLVPRPPRAPGSAAPAIAGRGRGTVTAAADDPAAPSNAVQRAADP